jgi:peptidoglycan/xylan/chitin deacetylase (PgdA/CDA1 family)
MDWRQLAQLAEAGWEIGAHTHTHGKMAEQHDFDGDSAVLREVEESHRLFRKHLGFVPGHFAYPSGSHNARTDEILREHYRSLRLWRWDWPIRWILTDHSTSLWGIESQNVDSRVPFEQFERIFHEALESPSEDQGGAAIAESSGVRQNADGRVVS